jgi:YkoY family integral membrane protein
MWDQVLEVSSPEVGLNVFFLLFILVALEAVLSADNAIALASIAKTLEDKRMQRKALNIGLILAFVLRIALIIAATWIIQFWQFELIGALYLLWLVFNYFTSKEEEENLPRGKSYSSLWQVIPLIAMTDLAFSLDSVTAAIAVADETWLIIIGATLGIITLRFLAGLFIRWLTEYTNLETAGYLTVGLVGMRLLVRVINPEYIPPEWVLVVFTVGLFLWGFSERRVSQKFD